MGVTTRGRVRAGVSGYHPGLHQDLTPGTEHDVPSDLWSEVLFEPVTPAIPIPLPAALIPEPEPKPNDSEVRPRWTFRTASKDAHKED